MKSIILSITLILCASTQASTINEIFGQISKDGKCYAKSYSAKHLAQHRKQSVKNITVKLDKINPWVANQEGAYIQVLVNQKKSPKKNFRQSMACSDYEGKVICAADCDGGSFKIDSLKEGNLTLTNNNLLLQGGCEEEDETIRLANKKGGDDTFVLNEVPMSACESVPFSEK